MKAHSGGEKEQALAGYKLQVNRAWGMGQGRLTYEFQVKESFGAKRIQDQTQKLKAALDKVGQES